MPLLQKGVYDTMRQLKFRVWDTVMRSWIPMGLNEISELVFMEKSDRDGGFIINTFDSEANRFIVQQFTGLLDCNGQEVYEGDIMQTKYDGHPPVSVDWKDGGFYYSPVKKDAHGNLFCVCEFTISEDEVIGNIIDAPKLLEEKK